MSRVPPGSVLFVTLDSCRYDTFSDARTPILKSVSNLYKAQAPSYFTYASHAAMFVGFTPGVPEEARRFINPKYARLFRLERAGWSGHAEAGFEVAGSDIIHGFAGLGYRTVGSAAVGWFDPSSAVARTLIGGFQRFNFAANAGVRVQVDWIIREISESLEGNEPDRPLFVFLNVGETHVPYHFEGAAWSAGDNPCVPFQSVDRRDDCRTRQRQCLEYVDGILEPLIAMFTQETILVCADHGDCWGEDGLWEHGIAHPCTLTVPLLMRYRGTPV